METSPIDAPSPVPWPSPLPAGQEQWSSVILDLQANRVILDRLALRYTMFRFTGGSIPAEQWNTSGMISYLARSSKAECIATKGLKRYLALIGTLTLVQLGVATAGPPRTLRDRCFITDEFGQVQSEIVSLGSHLESSMGRVLDASERSS